MPLTAELLQIIETICADGCESVRNIITESENGNQVAEISSLSSDEQAIVLAELKAVIAVYDDGDNDGCS